jgi:hypothetical protein
METVPLKMIGGDKPEMPVLSVLSKEIAKFRRRGVGRPENPENRCDRYPPESAATSPTFDMRFQNPLLS